jgi:hypothetical protein
MKTQASVLLMEQIKQQLGRLQATWYSDTGRTPKLDERSVYSSDNRAWLKPGLVPSPCEAGLWGEAALCLPFGLLDGFPPPYLCCFSTCLRNRTSQAFSLAEMLVESFSKAFQSSSNWTGQVRIFVMSTCTAGAIARMGRFHDSSTFRFHVPLDLKPKTLSMRQTIGRSMKVNPGEPSVKVDLYTDWLEGWACG